MLIFGAIFIYVIICVILYFQTDHIVRYEVTEGSLATNNIYRGVSIRTEEVVSTDTAGYVNFYAREGERVADVVCLKIQYHTNDYINKNSSEDEHTDIEVQRFSVFFIFLGCSAIGKPPFLSLTFEKPRLASEASHT